MTSQAGELFGSYVNCKMFKNISVRFKYNRPNQKTKKTKHVRKN